MRPLLLAVVLLSGCAVSYGRLNPWRTPAPTQAYRLQRIAADPSELGTNEALDALVEGVHRQAALNALEAAIPAAMAPIEQRIDALDPNLRRDLYTLLQRHDHPRVQALLKRVALSLGEGQLEAVKALTGRSDPESRVALLELATQASDPTARVAAIEALAPAKAPAERNALLAMVQSGTPREQVLAALRALGTAQSPAELNAALAHTHDPDLAAGALLFVARTRPLPAAAADTLSALLSSDDLVLRWEAARALVVVGQPQAMPVLLGFADDEVLGADALRIAQGQPTLLLAALRTNASVPTSAAARASLAASVAQAGGPDDAALLASLAPPDQLDDLQHALELSSAGVLFPQPVRYWLGQRPGEDAVTHTASEALAVNLKVAAAAKDDPALRYVALARALLAGARSPQQRAELEAAAEALRNTRAIYLPGTITAAGYLDPLAYRDVLTGELVKAAPQGFQLRLGPPPPGLPAGSLKADLVCNSHQRGDTVTSDIVYSYQATAPNPAYLALKAKVNALAPEQRCVIRCGAEQLTCGPDPAASLKKLQRARRPERCSQTTIEVAPPELVALQAQLDATPPELSKTAESSGRRNTQRMHTDTSCKGTLELTLGALSKTVKIEAKGRKTRESFTDIATETNYFGRSPRGVKIRSDPQVTDNRSQALRSAIAAQLGPATKALSAEVQRSLATAQAEARRSGNLKALRTLTLWRQPELIATEPETLEAFRAVFFSDGRKALRLDPPK